MKQSYIPDENILILAHQQENDQKSSDLTCWLLIQKILAAPAARIVVDTIIWDKYWTQASKYHFHSDLRNPLYQILIAGIGPPNPDGSWPNKVTLLPNAPCFPEENQIPVGSQDDLQFARLAVHTRATLVTTDQSLHEGLQESDITAKYDLTVLSPEDALRQFPPEKEAAEK